MALNPTPRIKGFRRSAIVATSAVAILFSSNAFAQTAGKSADCNKLGPTNAGVQCALKELDYRIDAANARGRAADARAAADQKKGAAADHELACLDLIMKDLESNGEKTAKLTAVPPKGQACRAARELKLISG